MSVADALIKIATSAGGGAIVVALIAAAKGLLTYSRRGEAAHTSKTQAEADEIEHQRWFREAAKAYERIEGECKGCRAELRVISGAFYELLDDLSDIDAPDVKTLKAQVRAAARKARIAADFDPNSVTVER